MNRDNFKLHSKYYYIIYEEKDYEAEVSYLHLTIQKYLSGAKKLLEYGSGTGKHGLLLILWAMMYMV